MPGRDRDQTRRERSDDLLTGSRSAARAASPAHQLLLRQRGNDRFQPGRGRRQADRGVDHRRRAVRRRVLLGRRPLRPLGLEGLQPRPHRLLLRASSGSPVSSSGVRGGPAGENHAGARPVDRSGCGVRLELRARASPVVRGQGRHGPRRPHLSPRQLVRSGRPRMPVDPECGRVDGVLRPRQARGPRRRRAGLVEPGAGESYAGVRRAHRAEPDAEREGAPGEGLQRHSPRRSALFPARLRHHAACLAATFPPLPAGRRRRGAEPLR